MTPGTRLRALLDSPGMVVAPGIFDGPSAALVTRHGFPAAYVSGGAASVAVHGLPDLGLMTASEMASHVERLSASTPLPLIVDMDTGYGNELNVRHAVSRLVRAGAAAVHIEDQVFPKRCGHLAGKEVIPVEDAVIKVRAAVAARGGDDLVVIARTDALTPLGIDEALRRGRLYAEAGADLVFVEAPETVDDLARIAASIDAPTVVNVLARSRTPLLSASDYEQMGFKLAIYPAVAMEAAVAAVGDALAELSQTGRPPESRAVGPAGLFRLVGLDDWLTWPAEVGAVPAAGLTRPVASNRDDATAPGPPPPSAAPLVR